MKKLLLILLCLPMIGFGQQPMTYVPDNNFENYLEFNLGVGNGMTDDYVPTSAIDTITSLNIQNENIYTLTGIEDFTALEYLVCRNNNIGNIDVSQNTALTYLDCAGNAGNDPFGSLNVTGLINLTYLDCSSNGGLNILDISTNTALTYLNNSGNGFSLAGLDVSNNTALTYLNCEWNQLTSLDVSQNTALTTLICIDNPLTSLDVSNNTALVDLNCGDNQLTSLDVSNNTALVDLNCEYNQLTSLDVSNNTALVDLNCKGNDIECLDISQNTVLNNVNCSGNNLTQLNTKNGNQSNFLLNAEYNSLLMCVEVDNIGNATNNWSFGSAISPNWPQLTTNCSYINPCATVTSIQEHSTNKDILKITDLLGRETNQINQPLFYLYDDGTVEKRITID